MVNKSLLPNKTQRSPRRSNYAAVRGHFGIVLRYTISQSYEGVQSVVGESGVRRFKSKLVSFMQSRPRNSRGGTANALVQMSKAAAISALRKMRKASLALSPELSLEEADRLVAERPHDRVVLRRALGAYRKARRYERALQVARMLARLPGGSLTYNYERVELLNNLGRFGVTDRYVRWLTRARDAGRIGKSALIRGLWVAHRPSLVLDAIGDLTSVARIDYAEIALRSFVSLRRYREAEQLIKGLGKRSAELPTGLVERTRVAVAFLDRIELATPAGTDASLAVLGRWLDMAQQRQKPVYTSVQKRVLFYTQSFRVGGNVRCFR